MRGAEVVRSTFHRSVIRSDARLDYDHVDRIFSGEEDAEAPWAEPLAAARAAAAALQARREARGALAIERSSPSSPSTRAATSTAGVSAPTESHRLIEHLMISANEPVATLLDEREIPTLYRVHERPEPEAVKRLVAQLASLDVATPPVPDTMSPSQAADIVAECSRARRPARPPHRPRPPRPHRARPARAQAGPLRPAEPRSRRPAVAALLPLHLADPALPGHRLPPRAAQRDRRGEDAPRAARLEEAGVWTIARERDAMTIERDADAVARCFLLERELFETRPERVFDGEVTGVIGAGAFVGFGDGHEGLLPVRRLRGDWWELNEEGTILLGAETGGTLRLGDPVRVRVERIDAPARARRPRPREVERRALASIAVAKARSARRRRGRGDEPPRAYRFDLLDKLEAASCSRAPRSSRCATAAATLKDGYANIRDGEMWLHNVHIPPYGPASRENHEPERAAQAARPSPRDRAPHRPDRRARAHARPDADLLLRPAGEGRDRARPRQGPLRQARGDQGARAAARRRARVARRRALSVRATRR